MRGVWTIAELTWLEARRRKIVLAAVLGGLAFLAIFGTALYFIVDQAGQNEVPAVARGIVYGQLAIAALYVVNFLTIALAIMLAVDTMSGEIASGVMQTIAAKPVSRSAIVLGKWLAYLAMTAAYLLLIGGGIVVIVRVFTGYMLPNLWTALPLMLLAAGIMLTVTIAGGVRFTTITNGIVSFGVYGIAFIGGWIEAVGALGNNAVARQIGTAISLLSPADAMWRRAAAEMQPAMMRTLQISPFAAGSTPNAAMIVWAIGFVVVMLALAIYQFRRRPL